MVNRRPVNRNPYQPVGDFVSNVSRFKIIESTLREGEQFANAFFDTGGSLTILVLKHRLMLTSTAETKIKMFVSSQSGTGV